MASVTGQITGGKRVSVLALMAVGKEALKGMQDAKRWRATEARLWRQVMEECYGARWREQLDRSRVFRMCFCSTS